MMTEDQEKVAKTVASNMFNRGEMCHSSLERCIESLILRLESVKESNPEFDFDMDIILAKMTIEKYGKK